MINTGTILFIQTQKGIKHKLLHVFSPLTNNYFQDTHEIIKGQRHHDGPAKDRSLKMNVEQT